MNPLSSTSRKGKHFDAHLGAVCALTWWDLGKLLAHRDDPAWIEKRISGWRMDLDPTVAEFLTVDAVAAYAGRVLGMLERKYDGESLATDAREIHRETTRGRYRDNGRYLEYDEDAAVFWAIEEKCILDELQAPIEGGEGWINAVDRCRECGRFFVKQRIDQIFDTSRCRTTFSNRDAYLRRKRSVRHR